jgi:hypothetical protein
MPLRETSYYKAGFKPVDTIVFSIFNVKDLSANNDVGFSWRNNFNPGLIYL